VRLRMPSLARRISHADSMTSVKTKVAGFWSTRFMIVESLRVRARSGP
jgi:hypothetical protein